MLAYWIILIVLTSKAGKFGDDEPWGEPVVNLPWFSDSPYDHQARGGYPIYPGGPERQMGTKRHGGGGGGGGSSLPPGAQMGAQMGPAGYPAGPGYPIVPQAPGHSVSARGLLF